RQAAYDPSRTFRTYLKDSKASTFGPRLFSIIIFDDLIVATAILPIRTGRDIRLFIPWQLGTAPKFCDRFLKSRELPLLKFGMKFVFDLEHEFDDGIPAYY